MRRRLRGVLIAVVVGTLVTGGCNPFAEPSYEEASIELKNLVDEALAAGLGDNPGPSKVAVQQDGCQDRNGVPTDEVQPAYEYHFPIELLGANPDAVKFVEAAENVWMEHGIDVDRHDTQGVVGSFGVGKGFNLEVFVNFNNAKALVAGNGPCVSRY